MALQLDDLALLDATPAPGSAAATGAPLSLPLASIDEDPQQPRQEFDAASLRELAATIAQRGVRQPVSVRPHPAAPGRWMLNFGARRLRASHLAGLAHIPAFVDHSADSYDQVVENEQRQALTPLELALFVQRRLHAGDTQAGIARRLGKSRALVTLATALIDAPAWLMALYRSGRCRGLTELYELRRLHAQQPQRTEALVAGVGEASIGRELLARWRQAEPPAASAEAVGSADVASPAAPEPQRTRAQAPPPGHALMVQYQGQPAMLVTTAFPPSAQQVYIQPRQGPRISVPAAAVQLAGHGPRGGRV